MKRCIACGERHERGDGTCPACGWAPAERDGFLSFMARPVQVSYPPGVLEELDAVQDWHFWFRARSRLLCGMAAGRVPEAGSFLEVGCGTGFVLQELRRAFPRLHLTGGEVFPEGLALARRRVPDATLLHMDVRDIPFADEFDAVGAFDVLEHLEDDRAALAQMCRAVRPGGTVLVTVPQHRWLWSEVDRLSGHLRRYQRAELDEKLRGAGLETVRLVSFVSWMVPLMLLARWRKRRGDVDLMAEFRIGRRTNAVLAAVLDLEVRVSRAGLGLPVGGSLMAVATRPRG